VALRCVHFKQQQQYKQGWSGATLTPCVVVTTRHSSTLTQQHTHRRQRPQQHVAGPALCAPQRPRPKHPHQSDTGQNGTEQQSVTAEQQPLQHLLTRTPMVRCFESKNRSRRASSRMAMAVFISEPPAAASADMVEECCAVKAPGMPSQECLQQRAVTHTTVKTRVSLPLCCCFVLQCANMT